MSLSEGATAASLLGSRAQAIVDCAQHDGDVAWMLISTVLVLSMVPGLALFQAGLLRLKNTVSVLTQTLGGLMILVGVWVVIGYSLVFDSDLGGVIGGVNKALFLNVSFRGCILWAGHEVTIPEGMNAVFQMMPACVTPLLITGTVAERMRWKPYLAFIVLYELLVFYPLAHWIWGNGWLFQMGVRDFAGGIVIHTSAGASALVLAAFLGRRVGYDECHGMFPHSDLRVATMGMAFLWTGWFGFSAGTALSANVVAIQTAVNTQVAAGVGGMTWLAIAWLRGKPNTTMALNGIIAGMAGITPASGYIDTQSSFVVAIVLSVVGYFSTVLLHKLRIDDALEVSCVHGVTGLVGSLAIGVCGRKAIHPEVFLDGLVFSGDPLPLGLQTLGVVVAIVFPGVVTFILLLIINRVSPVRAKLVHELEGLDKWHHREDVVRFTNVDHNVDEHGDAAAGAGATGAPAASAGTIDDRGAGAGAGADGTAADAATVTKHASGGSASASGGAGDGAGAGGGVARAMSRRATGFMLRTMSLREAVGGLANEGDADEFESERGDVSPREAAAAAAEDADSPVFDARSPLFADPSALDLVVDTEAVAGMHAPSAAPAAAPVGVIVSPTLASGRAALRRGASVMSQGSRR